MSTKTKTLLEQAKEILFSESKETDLKGLWDEYTSIFVNLDQGYGNNERKLKTQLNQIYKKVSSLCGKECADDMKDAANHRLGYSEYLSGKDYHNAVAMEKKLRKKHKIKM